MKSNAYNFSNDLARIGSALSRAMLGNASDDANIALANYRDAQTEGQNQENKFLQGRNDAISTASNPTGIVAQGLLGSMGLGLDENNNLVKLQPPGARPQTIPAFQNQTTMTQADLLAQSGALARAIFSDGKYSPNQLTEALGDFGANRDSNMARSMILDPAATEDAIRRAAMILNQNQVVTERGQDIKSGDTQRGQDIKSGDTQRGQDIKSGDTQRGQDIRQDTTERGQDIRQDTTERGQDIRSDDTQRGQDVRSDDTQRGQDIRSTDTQRGQDTRSTDTQRGQDIRSTDTQRGQDTRSTDTQRGQDIRSTDTQRGQDIRSTDTQRGQDIRSTDTQRGQDMRSDSAKDTRKRPSPKDTNATYAAITDAVEDYDRLPTIVKGTLRASLLEDVDLGLEANPDASYDAVYANAVSKVLSAGVTEIDTGYNDKISDFGFPTYFYNKLIGADPTEIGEAAKELGYSEKQIKALVNQLTSR